MLATRPRVGAGGRREGRAGGRRARRRGAAQAVSHASGQALRSGQRARGPREAAPGSRHRERQRRDGAGAGWGDRALQDRARGPPARRQQCAGKRADRSGHGARQPPHRGERDPGAGGHEGRRAATAPAQIARDVRGVQSLGFFRNVRVFTDADAPTGTRRDLRGRGEPGRPPDLDLGQRIDRQRQDPRHRSRSRRARRSTTRCCSRTASGSRRSTAPRATTSPTVELRASSRSAKRRVSINFEVDRRRQAQAARDRLRRQRALQQPPAARRLPDPGLALLVARHLVVRPLGHLFRAALRPGPARRRAEVHRRGLPARRRGRAGGGGRTRTGWS